MAPSPPALISSPYRQKSDANAFEYWRNKSFAILCVKPI